MSIKQKNITIDFIAYSTLAIVLLMAWATTQTFSLLLPKSLPSIQLTANAAERAQPSAGNSTNSSQASIIASMVKLSADLQTVVDDFAGNEPNEYGIYIEHLATGAAALHNPDQQFITASLYKPFAVVESLRMVEDNKLSLKTVLSNTDGRTVNKCIWDTITVSDNPCGRALRSISGLSTSAGISKLSADGYENTAMTGDYPVSTARDVAHLFKNLYEQKLLKPAENEIIMNALLHQQINNRLPQGLPEGTEIAHKTGDLEGVVHDGGIVYNQKHGDYIIVVLSGPDDSGRDLYQRYERFGDLAASINSVIDSYNP